MKLVPQLLNTRFEIFNRSSIILSMIQKNCLQTLVLFIFNDFKNRSMSILKFNTGIRERGVGTDAIGIEYTAGNQLLQTSGPAVIEGLLVGTLEGGVTVLCTDTTIARLSDRAIRRIMFQRLLAENFLTI
jgi:hypothetical protein